MLKAIGATDKSDNKWKNMVAKLKRQEKIFYNNAIGQWETIDKGLGNQNKTEVKPKQIKGLGPQIIEEDPIINLKITHSTFPTHVLVISEQELLNTLQALRAQQGANAIGIGLIKR
jgi:polynucleotide 5'-kinase involved in rRNA processing